MRGAAEPGAGRGVPTLEEFESFFAQLREAGYRLDPSQLAAAQKILLAARVEGHDGPTRGALKTALAPIFAKSPTQQEDFYRRYDAWHGPVVIESVTPNDGASPGPADVIAERSRAWPVVASAVAVLLLAIVSFVSYQKLSYNEPPDSSHSEATKPIGESPETPTEPTPGPQPVHLVQSLQLTTIRPVPFIRS